MLAALRKSVTSWVFKILLALLVVAFAIWGVEDLIRGGAGTQHAIVVGDIAIGPERVAEEFNREVNRLRPVFGGNLTREQAIEFGILQRTVQQMVSRAALDQAASRFNLMVSDEALRREIMETPEFLDEQGNFDRARFQRLLAANGLTEAAYLELLRGEIARARLMTSVAGGMEPPRALAEAFYRFREERRSALAVFIHDDAMEDPGQPDEHTVSTFYQENEERYRMPEFRSVTAIFLTPETVADELAVDEEMLRQAYEDRREWFQIPERRFVEQVLLDFEEEAERIFARLREGRTWTRAAEDEGAIIAELGWITERDMLPAMAEIIFALDPEEVSAPVESPVGWHLFRVTEVEDGHVRPFEEVRDELTATLADDRAMDVLFDLSIRLEDRIGAGATLEEAARDLDLPLVVIKSMDREGRDRDGNPIEAAPLDESVIDMAFSLQPGEDSHLMDTTDGFYILRLDDIHPPAMPALEDIRERVVADWRAQARARKARETAERLAEDLALGRDVGDARAIGPFTRDGRDADGLPRDAVERLFTLSQGGTTVIRVQDGFAALRLSEIIPADPASDPRAVERLRDRLAGGMAEDMMDSLAQGLAHSFGARINQSVIDRRFQDQ